jgi:Acetyltransferase (GNAT) domain
MKPVRFAGILPVLRAPLVPKYDINGGPMVPDLGAPALLRQLLLGNSIPASWPRVINASSIVAEGPVWDELSALASSGELGLTLITSWERAILERGAADSAEAYLNTFMSASQRKRQRQKRKALEAHGPLQLSVTDDPASLGEALDAYERLEAEGWKGRNGTALAQDAKGRAYVRDVMAGKTATGTAFAARLICADRTIAAGLFLRTGSEVVFWKTTYDETLAKHSPGVLFDMLLTEWLYTQDWFERMDAGHDDSVDPAGLIWKQRRRMANIVIDLVPGSWKGRAVVSLLRARQRLKRWRNGRLQHAPT